MIFIIIGLRINLKDKINKIFFLIEMEEVREKVVFEVGLLERLEGTDFFGNGISRRERVFFLIIWYLR